MAPPRKHPPPRRGRTAPPRARGRLRIIGGEWRGRRLSFAALEGLRPTPDRVRETLFNWLEPAVRGARCLDLFAGSGALGLEALSRGAAHCDFVDIQRAAAQSIGDQLRTLGAGDRGACHVTTAAAFLATAPAAAWDLVFVDPPFGRGLARPALQALRGAGILAPGALVYLETGAQEPPEDLASWEVYREKTAAGVISRLLRAGRL